MTPAREAVGGTGRSRAAFMTAVADLERGQERSLVRYVDFSDGQSCVGLMEGSCLAWDFHAKPTSQQIAQRLTRETVLTVQDPIPDHPEAIYDIAPGGHVAWVWLLHYLGNFYVTALLEDSPPCLLEHVERDDGIAQVTGRVDQGPPLTFEVPLDGTYDVSAVAFDIGFGLRAGRNTLLYL